MKPKYKEKDYAYWDKLFDGRRDITIPDVVQMVTEDLTIYRSRRLKLCLIIIVDGVLIAPTQPARPTLKHVKRVESLKNFLAFQLGKESFYWTVSGMIPPKRIMGVCDDPTGELCTKLRQKTKKMTGLPLALQLVAYECIPQLLTRLGGNDDQEIIDYESLPQHTGLNLVDVSEAEHHPELTVQPMMEIGPDKPDGWGEWDDEIDDRRVKYMVRLIEDGHKFKKYMWRGGDAAEDLYDHEKRKATNKRKRQGDDDKYEELVARFDALEKIVGWMIKRLGRRKRIGVTPRKEMFCKEGDIPETPIVKDVGEDVSVDEDDVGIGNENLPAESEDVEAEDEEDVEDNVSEDEEEDDQEKGSRAKDVEMEGMSSEEPPEVLAPLKEGNGVPLQWVDDRATAKSGCVLYRATTNKTFFVSEDEGCIDGGASGKMVVGEAKDGANVAEDGDEAKSKESDGVNVKEPVGPSGDGGMDDCTTKVAQVSCTYGQSVAGCVCALNNFDSDTQELSGLDKLVGAIVRGTSGEVDVGLEANAVIKLSMCTSWLKMNRILKEGRKFLPLFLVLERRGGEIKGLGKVDGVEDVADVGAEPFSVDQIVPAVEDIDFGYFEKVLLTNPKVLHLGAGKYDLDNQFFLDLATPCKWMSTKHMEVLVDYVSERHGALLKENRDMFVDPWFVDHLLGKARSFKAETYKGRVFSDPKLAGYLTKEGKKLGVDVDIVYGPMIWGTNHWVGLAINIRTWRVQVFDSDRSLRSMEEVMVIMSPIAQMLPYLVRKVCPPEFLLGHGMEPFVVERMEVVYQNRRSGDCGPVAVKFMELSLTSVEQPGLGDITDNAVDIFRKQYAMDVYRDWIVPLYMGGDTAK
ncbi:hypothetical protein HID58_049288 [Brassica napus]|uniref:Ubiquitin-like protease family profile domain-containing protein n=1 Tax=Brassica napus TaxID=3708 RepID=A0ABQ8B4K6_BRANA|nr:hypothetical protein HID58_049288 [Brassica napus]